MHDTFLALVMLGGDAACRSARQCLPPAFDLIIENGRIIDGTGSPWYAASVGIRGGTIAAMRGA